MNKKETFDRFWQECLNAGMAPDDIMDEVHSRINEIRFSEIPEEQKKSWRKLVGILPNKETIDKEQPSDNCDLFTIRNQCG